MNYHIQKIKKLKQHGIIINISRLATNSKLNWVRPKIIPEIAFAKCLNVLKFSSTYNF